MVPPERRYWFPEDSVNPLFYDVCVLNHYIQGQLSKHGLANLPRGDQLTPKDWRDLRSKVETLRVCEGVPVQTLVDAQKRVNKQRRAEIQAELASHPRMLKLEAENNKMIDYLQRREENRERLRSLPRAVFQSTKSAALSSTKGGIKFINERAKPLLDFFNLVKLSKERLAIKLSQRVQAQAQSKRARRLYVFDLTYEPTQLMLDDPEVIYENITYEQILDRLPSVLTGSHNNRIGKTLIILSTIFDMPNKGSIPCKVVNALCKHFKDTGKNLKNVSVINCFRDIKDVIPSMSFVHKIINVYPPYFKLRSRALIISRKLNVLTFKYRGSTRTAVYRILDEDECGFMSFFLRPTRLLKDRWWYLIFVSQEPVCARNRLIQTTGTCWWNTSMNILILTDSIAALLRIVWSELPQGYKDEIEGISLESCPLPSMSLRDFLFVLINQVVIKDERAKPSQKNFSEIGAGYTRSAYDREFAFKEKVGLGDSRAGLHTFMDANEGGNTGAGLEVCLPELFVRGPHFNVIQYDDYHEDLKEEMRETRTLTWSHTVIKNRNDQKLWKAFPHPLIVMFVQTERIPWCPLTVKINSAVYTLESAGLDMTFDNEVGANHAIAGLTCHSPTMVRYVFDPNNFLATDDWTTLEMKLEERDFVTASEPTDTLLHNQTVLASWRRRLRKQLSRFVDFGCLIYIRKLA